MCKNYTLKKNMYSKFKNTLYMLLGFLSVLLAILGIFLPLLPTTPFALLAAYFFSQSSPYFHQWLLNMPILGVLIGNWEEHKIISLKAKISSTILMVLLFLWSIHRLTLSTWQIIALLFVMTGILSFIWSRNSKVK